MICRNMYQWQPEFCAGFGDIRGQVNVDVLGQTRFNFAFLYTGKACSVDNNLRLCRFKCMGEAINRFKIDSSGLGACE